MTVAPREAKDELEELCRRDGDSFVEGAFRVVLARAPDAEGARHYARMLREGSPKRRLLRDLLWSKEGQSKRAINERFVPLLPRTRSFASSLRRLKAWLLRRSRQVDGLEARVSSRVPLTVDLEAAQGARHVCVTASRDLARAFLHVDGRPVADLGPIEASASREIGIHPYVDDVPHVVQIVAWAEGVAFRSPARTLNAERFLLYVDRAALDFVEGWCVDASNGAPLAIRAHDRAGRTVEVVRVPRADVQARFGGTSPMVGFVLKGRGSASSSSEFVVSVVESSSIALRISLGVPYIELRESLRAIASSPHQPSSQVATIGAAMGRAQGHIRATVRRVRPQGMATAHPVSVVVPVYGGVESLRNCVASVLLARNDVAIELIIVEDGSPYAEVRAFLDEFERDAPGWVRTIRSPLNGGFSVAVNLGIVASGRADVIVLNSDTIVSDGWVDGLVSALRHGERTGTVTALSNNAEICSAPNICEAGHVAPEDVAHYATFLRSAARGARPAVELPVGVGFCMLIARECLDEVGLFDAEEWGRGYGEEVDFCLKASTLGWRHVAAASVFVAHVGGTSFGEEKRRLMEENGLKISSKYPFYDALVQHFIATDPLCIVRHRFALELLLAALPNRPWALHVTHGFGGGTERAVVELAQMQRDAGYVVLVVHAEGDGSITIDVEVPQVAAPSILGRAHRVRIPVDRVSEVIDVWREYDLTVRLHTPLDVPQALLDWCGEHANLRVSVHDYAWVCPRVFLANAHGTYCGEPAPFECNACVDRLGAHRGAQHHSVDGVADIVGYRSRLFSVLEHAVEVTVPGEDVKSRLLRHGVAARFAVRPHPTPASSFLSVDVLPVSAGAKRVKTVLVLGAIGDVKGVDLVVACARLAHERRLGIRFVVLGHTSRDAELASMSTVSLAGPYRDDEVEAKLRAIAPDVALFASQVPETFSYVLSTAFWLGIWPVVSDIGVPAERVREARFGSLFSLESSPMALLELLGSLTFRGERCPESAYRGAANAAQYERR
jgi:GT2 family glycosyltransferase